MRRALLGLTLAAIVTARYAVVVVVGVVVLVGGYLTWGLAYAETWARDEFRPYGD